MQSRPGCNAPFLFLPVSIRHPILRCIYWFALSILLVVVLAVLAVKGWVLPNIDRWREPIASYLGRATSAHVQIGGMSASWKGLHPRFVFRDVQVSHDKAAPGTDAPGGLHVPEVVASLQWQSFTAGEPRFSYLSMKGVTIGLALTPDDRLRVAGQEIDLRRASSPAQLADNRVLQWLRQQGHVLLDDATIHWVDERRDAPPLTVEHVALALRNEDGRHRASLSGTPQGQISGRISLTADLDATVFASQPEGQQAGDQGVVYVDIEDMHLARWRPWVDLSAWDGVLSARLWAYLAAGKIDDVRADARAQQLRWRSSHGDEAEIDSVNFSLTGAAGNILPQGWRVPVTHASKSDGLNLGVRAVGLQVSLPTWFERDTWHADRARGKLRLVRQDDESLQASFSDVGVAGPDVVATLEGMWANSARDRLGNLTLNADIERARLDAIYRYLPRSISSSVRRWLSQALVGGEVRQGRFETSGPLATFPYEADAREQGRFMVEGEIVDGVLDYLPNWRGEGHAAGWPRIEGLQGRFGIDRTALTIQGDVAQARMPGRPSALHVGPVLAHIPDMAHQGTLLLDGQTAGDLADYLDVVQHSALNAMASGVFANMRGAGPIRLPLVLNIPLDHPRDAQLRADVQFDQARLRIDPRVPKVRQIDGRVTFTRDQVRADGLRASWLGGPVRADGIAGPQGKRLTLNGAADMRTVERWAPGQRALLQRLDGRLTYRAVMTQGARGGVDIDVDSDLRDVALQLPAPLDKAAGQAMPLAVRWRSYDPGLGAGALDLTLGATTRIRMEQQAHQQPGSGARKAARAATPASAPFFTRAAVAIDQPLVMPAAGLRVDASLGLADLRPWRSLVRDLQAPAGEDGGLRAPASANASSSGLLGPQRDIRVKADRLSLGRFMLDALSVRARRFVDGKQQGWDAAIDARQVEGRIDWRSAPGGEAGKVVARLSRLDLVPSDAPEHEREQAAQELADGAVEDLSSVPGIDLSADAFSLGGRALGELQLHGTNVNDGAQWRLDTLQIRNPSADMQARGVWTARGEHRGLAAITRIDVHDLGNLLTRLGAPHIAHGGRGTIDARVTWANSPWSHRFRDIDGELDVDLRSGRLLQVDSTTVKLLELFSLQSLPRLVTLKANPAGVLGSGFPYDEVKSHVRLDKGVLRVDDYAIDGPVARVKLVGESNVEAQTWDVKATVVPKVDASGAALAAGFLVNPLVGAGAMVGQWLFRPALEAALTQRFCVSGHWDDPVIENVDTRDAAR